MTFSGLISRTSAAASKNFEKGRRSVGIDHFVVHHQAGYSATTLGMMSSGSRQVSATYVINSDGTAVGVVQEEDTPYTNSDGPWNRRSITFEIENSPGIGKPTPAAHEITAQIIADAATRHGIDVNRSTVLGHRELYTLHGAGYATACPGELDIDWIVSRAREIQGAGTEAPPVLTPAAGVAPIAGGWAYWEPNGTETAKRVQKALKARKRYAGPVDGVFGPKTRMGVQETLRVSGVFMGLVDGDIQQGGCFGIQTYAAKFGDYIGPVDGALGINSWAGFALGLERP